MKTTDYLDAVRARFELDSDNAISKKIGVSRQNVSNYRHKRHFFDDSVAARVARLLDIEPGVVIADAQAERAKTPEMIKTWKRISKQLGQAASHAVYALFAVILSGLALFAPAQDAQAQGVEAEKPKVYILCKIKELLIFLADALLGLSLTHTDERGHISDKRAGSALSPYILSGLIIIL